MNPRHRRLLIPGLLVALLVVVLVAALVDRSDAAIPAASQADAVEVCRVSDPRVTEASGMVVSAIHQDLAYLINDSGSDAEVFAVRVSTGAVVGVTTVETSSWWDPEAMTLGADGTLWIADTGDNDLVRKQPSLLRIDEPGEGDHRVAATVYPIALPDGADDIESVAFDPADGSFLLVAKRIAAGPIYRVGPDLTSDALNPATITDWSGPLMATDASMTPDGTTLLIRNYLTVVALDASTGEERWSRTLPDQDQGETLAVEPSGESFLVGSEGVDQAIYRLGLSADEAEPATPTSTPSPSVAAGADDIESAVWNAPLAVGVGVFLVVLAFVASRALRRVR
ncbi:MAG: hypothetical protein QM658_17490 [Gordonia sp. (in: high G+C Gram-positive bacteria)]